MNPEVNPGPAMSINALPSQNSSEPLLSKLSIYDLRPLGVGGDGECLFKLLTNHLYGDSKHHLEIGATDIRYLNAT